MPIVVESRVSGLCTLIYKLQYKHLTFSYLTFHISSTPVILVLTFLYVRVYRLFSRQPIMCLRTSTACLVPLYPSAATQVDQAIKSFHFRCRPKLSFPSPNLSLETPSRVSLHISPYSHTVAGLPPPRPPMQCPNKIHHFLPFTPAWG